MALELYNLGLVLFAISAASAIKETTVTVPITAPQTHNTLPAAYQGEAFTVSVNIRLEEDDFHPITATLVLPHQVVDTPDCRTHTTGIPFDCSGNVEYYTVYAEVVDLSSSTATYGTNILREDLTFNKYMDLDNTAIELEFGNMSTTANGLPQGVDDEITYSVSLRIKTGYHGMSSYPFVAKVTNGGLLNVNSVTNTSQSDLAFVGPDVRVTMQSVPSSGVDAGDNIVYTFSVRNDGPLATESATNLRIEFLDFSESVFVGSDGQQTINGGSPTSIPKANLDGAGGTVGPLTVTVGDTLTYVFTRLALDKLLIGTDLQNEARVTFTNAAGNTAFVRKFFNAVPAKDLVWTSEPSHPNNAERLVVGPGETITKEFNFDMPQGTITSFGINIEFESGILETIPISFTSSKVDLPNDVVVTTSRLMSIGPAEFIEVHSRRKRDLQRQTRAVPSLLQVTRPLSGLVNSVIRNSIAPVSISITFAVNSPIPSTGGPITSRFSVGYNGITQGFAFYIQAIGVPALSIAHTVEMVDDTEIPNILRFNVSVEHAATSTGDAHQVQMIAGNQSIRVIYGDMVPPFDPRSTEIKVTDNAIVVWDKNELDYPARESLFLSYRARLANDGKDLPDGKTYIEASVTYYTAPNASDAYKKGPIKDFVCIEKNPQLERNLLYDHGFTVLMFIVGVIVAVILVAVGYLLFLILLKRRPQSSVGPSRNKHAHAAESRMKKLGRGLLGNASAAVKKGAKTIKDLSETAVQGSILFILSLRDKLKMHREIDNQDIMSTIDIDTDIESERNWATIEATKLLIVSLRNRPVPKGVEEKAIQKFDKAMKENNKKMDDDYKKELGKILDALNLKHKEKFVDLLVRQEQDKEELEETLRNRSQKEQEEVMELEREQHELEVNELTYQLHLERDEEVEKLRKEYAIRKRMGIKELQNTLLDDIKVDGKLTAEQADWLMKQHIENQARLEKLYDEEISRQRMALEEKLAKRRALVTSADDQEKHQSEMLNTLAEQQFDVIDKMRQVGNLSKSEAKELMRQLQADMLEAKDKWEIQRKKGEAELHKKLSERKRARLHEQDKKHQQELNELDKKQQSQQTEDVAIDPISILESRQNLKSHHRAEMSRLEDEVDSEQAEELEKYRDDVAVDTQNNINTHKEKLLTKAEHEGLTEKQIQKLMRQHAQETEKLKEYRQRQKMEQSENLKAQLEKRRREWSKRQEMEQIEQQALREHEDQVVRKIMGTQLAMSEDERDRILQEHEKQMVKLENSLTLNKLRQKRMLEDKLAHKRTQRMQKLEKLQNKELRKIEKAARDDDMYEDDVVKKKMKLLRKHAQERLDTLQDPDIRIEDEMDEVRNEMLKERATALKEQEIRLGAMLASLQIEKAKELGKIEEQQKAINSLKTNLMDDLNEKGIISDPELQRVINIHQQDREKLNKKLQTQKEKQEQILRQRLQGRMQSREESLAKLQEAQLHDTMSNTRRNSSTAAKIRMAAMRHKHGLEQEQFRQRIDKEISQTLEELKRQNNNKRLHYLQEQEMQFIAGLVQLGQFSKEELTNVLVMLYPNKNEEERDEIMKKLCEGYEFPREEEKTESRDDRRISRNTLESRIRRVTLDKIKDTNDEQNSLSGSLRGSLSGSFRGSLSGSFKGKKSALKKKKKSVTQPGLIHEEDRDDNYVSNPPIGYRRLSDYPESGRASVTFDETDYYANDMNSSFTRAPARTPATKLPPLSSSLPPIQTRQAHNIKKRSGKVGSYNYSSD